MPLIPQCRAYELHTHGSGWWLEGTGGMQNGAITAQDEAYLPQEEKANLVLRFSDGIVSHFLTGWKSLLIFELQSPR